MNTGFDEPFTEVQPDAGYYGDGAYLDPRLVIALIVIFLIGLALVWLTGKWGATGGRGASKRRRDESARDIYKSVRWYLDRALKSSGAVILERGREVAEVLNARLGYVMDLSAKQNRMLGDLRAALNGEKDARPADPTPKVSVPLATEVHYYKVWEALQALDAFWQEETVLPMIRAAQNELTHTPKPERQPIVMPNMASFSFRKAVSKPAKVTVVAPGTVTPQAESPKAAIEMPQAATVALQPEPAPPAPASPPPKKARNLPAHKRNMLA